MHKNSNTKLFNKQSLNIFDSRTRLVSKVSGRIKHMDMVESQIFIVYHEPCINLDVYELKGNLVESFDMS